MAADLSDRLGVPKLGVDNYGIWSKKMRFALTVKGLWSAISDPEDPGNEKALAFIGLSMEDHNMNGNNSGNNDSNGDDRACWYCGKKGHFKAECPKRKTACLSAVTEICR